MLKFILITNDPDLAVQAEAAGVDRIMVDLEQLGKQARQGHLDTLISSHSVDDVSSVRAALDTAELIVRTNPLNPDSLQEVDAAIEGGAQLLMLPMFRSAAEVAEYSEIVRGRVPIMPLVETIAAVKCLDQIVQVPGVSEIYIGLNDLHLEMELNFMFEPLADRMIDEMVTIIKKAQLPFGFGGVARAGEGVVPGELVLAEHARLGSSTVLLSRTFLKGTSVDDEQALAEEVGKLKSAFLKAQRRDTQQVDADRGQLVKMVKDYARARASEKAV